MVRAGPARRAVACAVARQPAVVSLAAAAARSLAVAQAAVQARPPVAVSLVAPALGSQPVASVSAMLGALAPESPRAGTAGRKAPVGRPVGPEMASAGPVRQPVARSLAAPLPPVAFPADPAA